MANNSYIPNMFQGANVQKMDQPAPAGQDQLAQQYNQQSYSNQPYRNMQQWQQDNTGGVPDMYNNSSMQPSQDWQQRDQQFQDQHPQAANEWNQHQQYYQQHGPYTAPNTERSYPEVQGPSQHQDGMISSIYNSSSPQEQAQDKPWRLFF